MLEVLKEIVCIIIGVPFCIMSAVSRWFYGTRLVGK